MSNQEQIINVLDHWEKPVTESVQSETMAEIIYFPPRAPNKTQVQNKIASDINPYLVHFGKMQERHFWKKNP